MDVLGLLPFDEDGQKALEYYVNKALNGSSLWYVPAFFAALWTPDTSKDTALALFPYGKATTGSLKFFKTCKSLATGYGVKIGRFEGLYKMPRIKGFVLFSWKFKNGKRFSIQYGHWKGIGNTPWYKRFYLKLPGKTNNHWPWGRP